ncbi:MAG: PEP-CTERM sorting domain-containing protein [Planctomycetota bacterium]
MKTNRLVCSAVLAGCAAMVAGEVSAQVLYSDTFSRVTGSGDGNGDPNGAADNFSDWGTNDNGLGGTVSQAWVAGPSRAGGGRNAVTDGALGISHGTSSIFEFDAAAASPDGFTVALDFSRFVVTPDPGPGGGGYIAFGLGVDTGSVPNDFTAIGASDFSVLFQQANSGNAANASVNVDNGASVPAVNFNYADDPDVPHTLLLTVLPQVSGAYGELDLIDINILVDGLVSQDFTVTGGTDFGTFTVSANNFDTRFIDNLVVTAVPEPASLVLLGMGGLMMVRRRAR